MKIYLDNCALGRLFDDQSQPRVAAEALAVETVLQLVEGGSCEWLVSAVLHDEIGRNSNLVRRSDTLRLLSMAFASLTLTPSIEKRGQVLQSLGFKPFDAQHVAFAEASQADVLLTTDDRLIGLAARCNRQQTLTLYVANPVDWLRKVTHG